MLQARKISVLIQPEFGCLHPELLSLEHVGSLRQPPFFRQAKRFGQGQKGIRPPNVKIFKL